MLWLELGGEMNQISGRTSLWPTDAGVSSEEDEDVQFTDVFDRVCSAYIRTILVQVRDRYMGVVYRCRHGFYVVIDRGDLWS